MRIFVCYAHEDSKWLDTRKYPLIPFLKDSLRKKGVEIWYDNELIGGDLLTRKVTEEIDGAVIAILLISGDFLNSDFIRNIELPRIKKRLETGELTVVPILVEQCDWKSSDFLRTFIMLPKEQRPLIRYVNNKGKWDSVRTEILRTVEIHLENIIDKSLHPSLKIYRDGKYIKAEVTVDDVGCYVGCSFYTSDGRVDIPPPFKVGEDIVFFKIPRLSKKVDIALWRKQFNYGEGPEPQNSWAKINGYYMYNRLYQASLNL